MNGAASAVITVNIDPIALHFGNGGLHWYGVMYAAAFITAYRFAALPHILSRGGTRQYADVLLTTTILTGLIGARLYFVIQQPDLGDYLRHPLRIIAVWEGGMAFFGAIISSLLTLLWFALKDRVLSFWILFDAGVLFAVAGQPIGRIGNVINGDILGRPSDAWFATAYVHPGAVLQSHFFRGVGYQPAAVYEALGTIAIGILLYLLRRRGVMDGILGIVYVAMYAVSQFAIFYLRDSEPVIGGGLKQAQWTSLAVFFVVVPLVILAWRHWTPPPREKASETTPAATAAA